VPEGLEDNWDEAVELAVVVDHTEVVVAVRRGLLQAGNDSAGLLWFSAKHISYFRFILSRCNILAINFSDSPSRIFIGTNLHVLLENPLKLYPAALTLLDFSSVLWIHIIL
jgi:hypothetical protein